MLDCGSRDRHSGACRVWKGQSVFRLYLPALGRLPGFRLDRVEGVLETGRHHSGRPVILTGNTLQPSLPCRNEPGQLGDREYRHDRRRDLVRPSLCQSREV